MSKTLTTQIQYLLQIWDQKPHAWVSKEVPKIKINKMVRTIASIYEKVRNIVDLRDEHLLRKNAIERILKRRFLYNEKLDRIPKPLVEELIRAGYLKDDTVPDTKIQEVHNILEKYYYLIQRLPNVKEKKYDRKSLHEWLVSLAACELEESLTLAFKEKAVIDTMYDIINPQFKFKEDYNQQEKDTQIYLAINRARVKSDRAMVAYLLFKLYHPQWSEPNDELKAHLVNNIVNLKKAIDQQVDHPLADRLWRLLTRKAVPFSILKEVIEKNQKNILQIVSSPDLLEEQIREVCQAKYKQTRKKLSRGIIRAILYIFITKSIFALLLEIPIEWYLEGHLDYRALGINVVFQPVLMFLIALTMRVPSEKNTAKIVKEIKYIIYGHPKDQVIHFKPTVKRSMVTKLVFAFLYTIIFGISFGLVILFLISLNFNIFSGIVFIFFLCLVSFFGFKLRASAKELVVLERKENWFTLFVDFLSIPLIRAGRAMSTNFAKINIFAFFLDFIFEAPFKVFLEILEDFFGYLREKREEVY